MASRPRGRLNVLCGQVLSPNRTAAALANLEDSSNPAVINALDLAPQKHVGLNLNEPGRESQDYKNPSEDVGSVKLFENDRIRVWDMCVDWNGPSGELFSGGNTGFHKHVHDYIFLQIGDGLCTTDVVDPKTGELQPRATPDQQKVASVKNKSCTMRRASPEAPAIHRLWNASTDTNYRQILIEFLETQPKHTEDEVKALFTQAHEKGYSTDVGSKLLYENERCRVWDLSLEPHSGEDLPFHAHVLDYFFVATCGGPNSPGTGEHGLRGWAGPAGIEHLPQNVNLVSTDRELVWHDVSQPFSAEDGRPSKVDKVWNHLDVPYCSFIVEFK